MITGDCSLALPVGQIVSLFSFLPVQGLSLRGFRFSLDNMDYPDGLNGLSNVIDHEEVSIGIKEGSLYLYVTNENTKS
jgi:thiamine pyrophosphokinase